MEECCWIRRERECWDEVPYYSLLEDRERVGLFLPTAFKHRNGKEQCSEISEVVQFRSTEDASVLDSVGVFAMHADA